MKSDYSKDMYRYVESLFAQVEELQEKIKGLERKTQYMEGMERELKTQELLINSLKEKNAHLHQENQELKKQAEELKRENGLLREEITRLKSNRDNDSHNSSNPPSTDQKVKKANEYNSRQKSGKKKGGQKGHPGKTLSRRFAEELIQSGKCKHSVVIIGDEKAGSYTTQYVLEVNVETEVKEYRIYKGSDSPFPNKSQVFYGSTIKALAAELYGIGVVSILRIQEIIRSITNGVLEISAGALYGFCRKLSELAQPSLKQIETHILNGTVAYTDATVVTVDGNQAYIRNISNEKAVRFFAMENKNIPALSKIWLLAHFSGIFVHDHETSLYRFGTGHGECNVHLLRYLRKNMEDCKNTWSQHMTDLLYEMKECVEKYAKSEKQRIPDEKMTTFLKRYDEIIQLGRIENTQTRPKWAKSEEKSLLNRLEKYKDNHLLFLKRLDVAFSNNMSERDLRKCKNRQKVSGGFRNQEGCEMFANILSVIETAKRLGMNPYNAILSIFQSSQPIFHFSID